MLTAFLKNIPPQTWPVLKMAARFVPSLRETLTALSNLEPSQISELDADIDILIDSLTIKPECLPDVARVIQKHKIRPNDMIGKLIVRITENDAEKEVGA